MFSKRPAAHLRDDNRLFLTPHSARSSDGSASQKDVATNDGSTVMSVADEPLRSIAPGGSLSGTVGSSGDVDQFTINLVAGQTYTVSLKGAGDTPLADAYLTLSNSAGTILISDDDGGSAHDSLITFTAPASGTYQIAAAAYPGSGVTGGYTLDVRQMGADSVGSTLATAQQVTVGQTAFGFIEASRDVDMFKVTLEEGKLYSFELAGGADYNTDPYAVPRGELDTRITLYDSAGNQITLNDDISFPDDVSSALSFLAPASGTYYIKVDAYSRQTGGFTLDVKEVDLAGIDPLDSLDWGTQLPSTAVSVYFAPSGQTFDGVTSLGWSPYEIDRAMAALQTWAEVSNLTFTITGDPATATFKLVTTESRDFLGYFNPPGETNAGVGVFAVNGDGWNTTGGLEPGGFGWVTLVHEFGHGLGLAHPHDDGGTSTVMAGVTAPFDSYGVYDLNQGVYTTMSYNDGWQLHPGGTPSALNYGWQGGPGAFDIALIQAKYGASSANTGDNVYVLPTANAAGTYWDVIWDTGGSDTIAHAGTVSARIDLTAATLDYSATGAGVISYVTGIYGGFTIAAGVVIENATGGSAADVLIGNSANNLLDGGAGNDVLQGNGGADTFVFEAGDGQDTITDLTSGEAVRISGYNSAQSITQSGADVIAILSSADRLTFQNTTVSTVQSALQFAGSSINGTAANDTLGGTSGDDTINGLDGADTIDGLAGDDALDGGNGNDNIVGQAGSDTLIGGEGIDRLFSDVASPNFGNVISPQSLDTLAEHDSLSGGAGNDYLFAGYGDTVDGGADVDVLYINFQGAAAGVHADFRDLIRYGSVTIGGATISNVEGVGSIVGSEFADFLAVGLSPLHGTVHGGGGNDHIVAARDTANIYGGDGDDYIDAVANRATAQHYGEAGNDTMIGGLSDDVFHGGDGNDVLDGREFGDYMAGGAGNDIYYVDSAGDRVVELAGAGTDTVKTSISYVLAANIENLTLTGSGLVSGTGNALANVLTGNKAANTLDGASGNDTLYGMGGDDSLAGGLGKDRLDGGGGADSMAGGTDNDIYYVDNAGDVVTEAAGEGTADKVLARISYTLGANVERLTLNGSAAIDGTGNSLANIITGNAAANRLDGGSGDDVLYGMDGDDSLIGGLGNDRLDGGAGADTMAGGTGNDTYYVNGSGDVVAEAIGEGSADVVRASISHALAANVERLVLTGSGATDGTGNSLANIITGNGAANRLDGGAGNDSLYGMGGDDWLVGGLGADRLEGGAGVDSFVFDAPLGSSNVDRITDFSGEDVMQLDQSIFTALDVGPLSSSAFAAGSAALDADDRVIYDSATGRIYYDADGNGSDPAVLFAQVTAGISLTNADFLIFG